MRTEEENLNLRRKVKKLRKYIKELMGEIEWLNTGITGSSGR